MSDLSTIAMRISAMQIPRYSALRDLFVRLMHTYLRAEPPSEMEQALVWREHLLDRDAAQLEFNQRRSVELVNRGYAPVMTCDDDVLQKVSGVMSCRMYNICILVMTCDDDVS